jgi:hypothetical protein
MNINYFMARQKSRKIFQKIFQLNLTVYPHLDFAACFAISFRRLAVTDFARPAPPSLANAQPTYFCRHPALRQHLHPQ